MTKEPLVLVIEDEAEIRTFLKAELRSQGFAAEDADTGEVGLSLAASLRPDVILLDLGLPDLDGLEVLHRLRTVSSVPVVILSARGGEGSKVKALDSGADDYLTKPFGSAELLARLKAVLRRFGGVAAEVEGPLQFGPLTWDRVSRRVFLGNDEVHLTPVEYRLFSTFALHQGRILTHQWLLREVWGRETLELIHYVRIAVAGLRKKLEPGPLGPRFFHTEVGVGYRFFDQD